MRTVAVGTLCCLLAAILLAGGASATIERPHAVGAGRWRARDVKHHPAFAAEIAAARQRVEAGEQLVDTFVNDTIELNGWIGLRIRKAANASSLPHTHGAVWYATGYAEGSNLQERIWQHYVNTVQPTPNASLSPEVAAWLYEHIAFIEKRVAQFNESDAFWKYTGLTMLQLAGMVDGYNAGAAADAQLNFFEMFVHNFQYELGDVAIATKASKPASSFSYNKGGCSAYVKPTPNDLFFAHTTWAKYVNMIRVYKDIQIGATRVAFSGYPGLIASGDDWYMLGTNLTVVETTNLIWNDEVYKFVVPQTVAEWIRVMVAHQMAVDGNSWVNAFRQYNSGTYNNQYMVLDNNKWRPGHTMDELQDGLLWIVEQMPGMAPIADVTAHIRSWGYWGSYNRPYFPEVFNVSGNWAMEQKYGDFYNHNKYVRAKMMARADPTVSTLADVQYMIRYNEWQTDPLSVCPGCKNPDSNPYFALGSRGDLVPHNANTSLGLLGPTGALGPTNAFGAIDAKVFSWQKFMANFSASVISGPPHQGQPPFRWSTAWVTENLPLEHTSHIGQADLQQWDWVDTLTLVPNV